jgi:hypothetical protein
LIVNSARNLQQEFPGLLKPDWYRITNKKSGVCLTLIQEYSIRQQGKFKVFT